MLHVSTGTNHRRKYRLRTSAQRPRIKYTSSLFPMPPIPVTHGKKHHRHTKNWAPGPKITCKLKSNRLRCRNIRSESGLPAARNYEIQTGYCVTKDGGRENSAYGWYFRKWAKPTCKRRISLFLTWTVICKKSSRKRTGLFHLIIKLVCITLGITCADFNALKHL